MFKFDNNHTPHHNMKSNLFRIPLITLIVLLASTPFLSCGNQKIVSLKTLLLEMIDRKNETLFPSPCYNLKQFSSYDRKTDSVGGKGWFANDDYTQFIGIDSANGIKEYILFDSDGPGAVVRWWMTFSGEGSYDGKIRVYIDNVKIPVLEENVLKLLSGHLPAGEPLENKQHVFRCVLA